MAGVKEALEQLYIYIYIIYIYIYIYVYIVFSLFFRIVFGVCIAIMNHES